MASSPPVEIWSGPREGSRLAAPASSAGPQIARACSGMNIIGSQPSATSAVMAHVLLAQRRHPDGDGRPHRVGDDLERLAQTGTLVRRKGHGVVAALVDQWGLPLPDLPTDVDDLAGPADGGVERYSVEALDDLGTRRAQPEVEPTVRERVDRRPRSWR